MASQSQAQSHRQQRPQPTLPPAQTFDILPPLHELLSRIDHSPTTNPNTTPSPHDSNANIISTSYADPPPLEPKDLPTEVLPIKNKCKRIPREIEKLPDVERSVEDQREEIRDLEEGIRRRREVLRRVGMAAEALRGGLGLG